MNERDVVYVPVGANRSEHPAVILRVSPDAVLGAVAGTGTLRDFPRVTVRRGSRDAMALGLYKDTHFYLSNVGWFRTDEAKPTGRRCPPALFVTLLAFALPYLDVLAGQRGDGE